MSPWREFEALGGRRVLLAPNVWDDDAVAPLFESLTLPSVGDERRVQLEKLPEPDGEARFAVTALVQHWNDSAFSSAGDSSFA